MATTTSLELVKKGMAKDNQAQGRSNASFGMVPVVNRPTLINN